VVLVTHSANVAAWADRVLIMDGGRLVGVEDSPDPSKLADELRRLGEGKDAGPWVSS
jgi:ABC-type transport system involved in cytochrome bd biosynthesis fused ATPase/permease subunit